MAGAEEQLPVASWQWPFDLGWDQTYTVRYASNLDDGPTHGMPLGGFGAGCKAPTHDAFNLWHLDCVEHWFGVLPDCQSPSMRTTASATAPMPWPSLPSTQPSRHPRAQPLDQRPRAEGGAAGRGTHLPDP